MNFPNKRPLFKSQFKQGPLVFYGLPEEVLNYFETSSDNLDYTFSFVGEVRYPQ